jgi:PKD repeat protein
MKKIIILLAVLTFSSVNAQIKHALFLGNSYTGVNNLPQLIKSVAVSFGDTLITEANTPGGYTLEGHSTNATSLSKIAVGDWDYVILQDQSQRPSFSPGQVAWQVYPFAESLVNDIKTANACTEPIFYMTWGRKNSDPGPCANGLTSSCTYNGMQQRLRESYMEMKDSNNAVVSPVGVAWKTMRDSFPLVELYSQDESHPSIHGSYLAACVFYATLYQKSPIGSTFIPAAISANDALNLQTVASYTVLDSLSLWGINTNKPTADFNYTGSPTVNFTNTSTNGNNYSWDFGDGNTSLLQNPTNTYTTTGNYTVELTTYSTNTCFTSTTTQTINVTITGIENRSNSTEIKIYPNPANNYIEIETTLQYSSIKIIDLTGKTIKQTTLKSKIDVSNLTNGIYFIQIIGKRNTIMQKIVKK